MCQKAWLLRPKLALNSEFANGALYEEQLMMVADYPDIVSVFANLQAASLKQRLPAF